MAVQSGVYRGATAAERASERRSRLLEAGLTVWADPATRTTMTAVCVEAGLSERYFYESFTGLDALLEAVLDEVAAEIEEKGRSAADAAGDDPDTRMRASLTAFVHLLAADPRKGRVAIIESVAIPELRRRRTELLRYMAHEWTVEVRSRLGDSDLGPSGGETSGLLFLGGMAELVTAWLDGAIEVTPEEIVEVACRALRGLYH